MTSLFCLMPYFTSCFPIRPNTTYTNITDDFEDQQIESMMRDFLERRQSQREREPRGTNRSATLLETEELLQGRPYHIKNRSVASAMRRMVRQYVCLPLPSRLNNWFGPDEPSVYVEQLDEGYSEPHYVHPAEEVSLEGSRIHVLPFEVLFCVFEYLDALTLLGEVRLVCKRWHQVLCSPVKVTGECEAQRLHSTGSSSSLNTDSTTQPLPSILQQQFFWRHIADQQTRGLFSHLQHVDHLNLLDYFSSRRWCCTNNKVNSIHVLEPYNIALAQFDNPPADFVSILERTMIYGSSFKFMWSGHSRNSRVMKIMMGIVFGDSLQEIHARAQVNAHRETFDMDCIPSYFGSTQLPRSLGIFLASGNVYYMGMPIFRPSREGYKWKPQQGDTISILVKHEEEMIHLRHNGKTFTKISFARLNLRRRDVVPLSGGCSLLLNDDMVSFPRSEDRENVFSLMRTFHTETLPT